MKFWEAIKALQEGHPVRAKWWHKDNFVTLDTIENCHWFGPIHWRDAVDDWEVYEEAVQLLSFQEMVKGMKEGKRFARRNWLQKAFVFLSGEAVFFQSEEGDLLAWTIDDFEMNDWIEVK